MDWLKEHLGEELYNKVVEKLIGNDTVKLANLASGLRFGPDFTRQLKCGLFLIRVASTR